MNALRNKVQLIGYVGNDPEIKSLKNSRKMASLSLATSETYKNADGKSTTDTQWHKVVAFGKVAEIIEKYVSKGFEIAVDGKLVYHTYTDANEVSRTIAQVEANEILILTKKG